ncbi:MAG: restriction endonuclease subunit S [Thermoguttaceae bacterium]|nr:restriction endonuclease subunit S [Thermoguttaceae bacterium]
MTPQELKNSILQLAIQGKLVEQRPEEGTAEELYKKIQAEKQKLIKAGKIRKEKPLPEITEDEIPFDIPEGWKWVHLNQIASSSLGKTLDKTKNKGEFCPYLCSINVYWSGISLETIKQSRFTEEDKDKYRLKKGDLLICEGGDVGRSAIWESEIEMYYQNALHRVRFYGDIKPYFFRYLLECFKGIGLLDEFSKGMTIKHLVQTSLNAMWLPLPPLAEQKRIVAKIEELLPLVDRYEKAWMELEELNKHFPDDLKKSLLQLAIQGKLVEQRPEEGTAEELYKKIQAEKQKLIKEGKIKKEKPLPEITEDEIPFDIPEGWKWVRLPCIASMCLGKMLDKQKNKGTKCPYLRNVNVRWGDFDLSDLLEMRFEDVDDERFLIQKNDIVMCEGGEPGRCAIWKKDAPIHFQKALHRIRFYANVNPVFYLYFFSFYSSSGNLNYLFTGTTIKHLTGQALGRIILPLPPLAEQKRIVAKLEELKPLCESLNGVN